MKNRSYARRAELFGTEMHIRKGPAITHFDMELTERCNNDCIHCYINRPENDSRVKAREMSTNKVKTLLDQISELGSLTVRFTGGEPLLRNDFEEIYLHARRLGLRVLLMTNATRIDLHITDLFCRIPPLEPVEISIYGMTQNSYERVSRIPGSFQAALQGVERLRQKNIPMALKMVCLPPNAMEVDAFEAWAASVAGPRHPPAVISLLNLRARRDSEEKNRKIALLRASPEQLLQWEAREPDRYRHEMQQFCRKNVGPHEDRLFFCGAGKTNLSLDAYGRLQPCLMLRDPSVCCGLQNRSLQNGISHISQALEGLKADNPEYRSRCARCFLMGLCEQCPAKSWMEHGSLDTPAEYFCRVAHAKAKYLGLIHEGEKGWKVMDWEDRIHRFVSSGSDGTPGPAVSDPIAC